MPSLIWATSLLILSLLPVFAVLLIWRQRMRSRSSGRNMPVEFGEWMRVVGKGAVIGRWSDQDIYAWLRVELADGSFCDLTPDRPSQPPGFCFRMVSLPAGRMTYWGLASNESWGHSSPMSASAARARGFSLIELMIVLAMIGILTAIALPMYRGYVQQSAAKAVPPALMQLAQQVQQFAQDNGTYVGACSSEPLVPNAQLTCPSLTVAGYTLEAQGHGPIAGLSYTLTQSGVRATPAGPPGWATSASCWVVDASGDCAP